MEGNQLFREGIYDVFNGDTHIPQRSKENTYQFQNVICLWIRGIYPSFIINQKR
jgi:hypothetical protein